MKHLKYLEKDLELYYLKEQVQKVDLIIVLLERQSANNGFLGYDNWRSVVIAVTDRVTAIHRV